MNTAYYYQTIPNSHFYTDLNQILNSINHELNRRLHESKNRDDAHDYTVTYVGERLTKEYLITGLKNSIKQGYELKLFDYSNTLLQPFTTIEQIIDYIKDSGTDKEDFYIELSERIKNTLNTGFNLTDGLTLHRNEVYKRIDGERDYQDFRWGVSLSEDYVPDQEKPPAEWINYIEYHISKAKDEIYHLNKDAALSEIRKVAALAVRALEIHGCPERVYEKPKDEVDNGGTGNPVTWKTTTVTNNSDRNDITYKVVPSTPTKNCGCGDDCDCKKDKK